MEAEEERTQARCDGDPAALATKTKKRKNEAEWAARQGDNPFDSPALTAGGAVQVRTSGCAFAHRGLHVDVLG